MYLCSNLFLLAMLNTNVCFYFSISYSIESSAHLYCWTRSSSHILYCLTYFTHVAFWNSNPQLQNVHTINRIVCHKVLVHCLPMYLLSGIPNRSTIDLVYNVACPMPIMLENSLMLALCLMLSSPYYAKIRLA